jgi:hypothetical protein
MRRIIPIGLLTLALACKVEKTGRDTYKVIAPTPEAKAAAQRVKAQTTTAAEKLGDELKKVGEKAKTESKTIGTKTETYSKKH